ncbi:MAG: hypothetical protein ACREMB_07810, partial [Candidatus Rokuibacteriota bacterium]
HWAGRVSMFAANLTFVLGALAVLAACGWWAVAPFRRQLAYPLAQAPLAGLVLAPIGTLAIMVALTVELRWAAAAAIAALAAGSLASAWVGRGGGPENWRVPLGLVIPLAAAAVWFVTRVDLFFGSPGLNFAHGTDHLGYAHVADWLQQAPQNPTRALAPDDWYGSWLQLMYTADPRFGSFAFLALVSHFSGRSAAFAYDLGCAVVLTAASLGVGGLFARRPATFAVLTAGLFTSFWFDWSRAGYLGKTTAYPATILTAGLLFAWVDRARREGTGPLFPLSAIAALTAGAAVFFPGVVAALFLALLGLAFVFAAALLPGEPAGRRLGDPVVAVALLVALAVLSSGIIARPLFLVGRIPLPWSWSELLLHATEVDGLLAARTGLPPGAVWALVFVLLATWAAVAALAVLHRVPAATAALIAPLALLGGLLAADLRWQAMNFIGMYVPLLLCGTAALADALAGRTSRRWLAWGLTALLAATVVSHLPRFAATAAFHGGRDAPPLFRFSARETDALAAAIRRGGGTALVDTAGARHFPIFLMVELGRRGIPLQWTEESWKGILGYRRWPVPTYRTRAPLRIVTRTEAGQERPGSILRTTQFELLPQD